MDLSLKPLSRSGRAMREPHVVGACPFCGTPRVITPCSNRRRCTVWYMVCECADATGDYLAAGGRCVDCREHPADARGHSRRNARRVRKGGA